MHSCPHCHQKTVANFQVRWATRVAPATCAACHQLSYVADNSSVTMGSVLIVSAGAILAAVLQSWWIGGGVALLAIPQNIVMWRRAELLPISAERVKESRAVSGGIFGLAWLLQFLTS